MKTLESYNLINSASYLLNPKHMMVFIYYIILQVQTTLNSMFKTIFNYPLVMVPILNLLNIH